MRESRYTWPGCHLWAGVRYLTGFAGDGKYAFRCSLRELAAVESDAVVIVESKKKDEKCIKEFGFTFFCVCVVKGESK